MNPGTDTRGLGVPGVIASKSTNNCAAEGRRVIMPLNGRTLEYHVHIKCAELEISFIFFLFIGLASAK